MEQKEFDLEAMTRLAKVMNDSPSIVKMGDTEFAITALKPGTQWLIAEEACKIAKNEEGNYMDMIKLFALNIPSVAKVLTLAILNDKDRIFSDFRNRKYSEEFNAVYETILFNTDKSHWIGLLVEVMNMLSMDYFFDSTNAIAMIREMALGRKKMKEERERSLVAQNTDK